MEGKIVEGRASGKLNGTFCEEGTELSAPLVVANHKPTDPSEDEEGRCKSEIKGGVRGSSYRTVAI